MTSGSLGPGNRLTLQPTTTPRSTNPFWPTSSLWVSLFYKPLVANYGRMLGECCDYWRSSADTTTARARSSLKPRRQSAPSLRKRRSRPFVNFKNGPRLMKTSVLLAVPSIPVLRFVLPLPRYPAFTLDAASVLSISSSSRLVSASHRPPSPCSAPPQPPSSPPPLPSLVLSVLLLMYIYNIL